MSCRHGNHYDGCDICDEVDASFEAGRRSALAEQPAPVQGWKLVPLQPTAEMIRAYDEAQYSDDLTVEATNVWAAMVAATPQAQPAQQECRCNQGQVCHVCDPITKGNT